MYKNIRFRKIFLIICMVLSSINFINCLFFKHIIIPLQENQILYIYSSIAQLIGALLGLTIAGYTMIDSHMKTISEQDNSASEYIDEIRMEHYESFCQIIYLSIIDIFMCLIILSIYDNYLAILNTFFMNEAIIFFFWIMIELIHFVLYLNPNLINKKGSQAKQEIDAEYKSNTTENIVDNQFSPFITYYNLLEQLLNDFAFHFISQPNSISPTEHKDRLRVFEALDILLKNEVILPETHRIIDDLRRYRNALVHSLDTYKSVNPEIYNSLMTIYNLLHNLYNAYKMKIPPESQPKKKNFFPIVLTTNNLI